MAPLILQPSFDEQTREEIEAFRAEVQIRRMVAAQEYHAGANAKLERTATVLSRRIAQQFEMLKKELDRLDKIDQQIAYRLVTINALKQEAGLTSDMMALHTTGVDDE